MSNTNALPGLVVSTTRGWYEWLPLPVSVTWNQSLSPPGTTFPLAPTALPTPSVPSTVGVLQTLPFTSPGHSQPSEKPLTMSKKLAAQAVMTQVPALHELAATCGAV